MHPLVECRMKFDLWMTSVQHVTILFYKDVWSITGYYVHEFVSMLANKIWTKHLQSTLKFFYPWLLLIVQFHLPPSDPSYWLRYDDYVLPFFSQTAFLWANNVPSWIERLEHVLYMWKKDPMGEYKVTYIYLLKLQCNNGLYIILFNFFPTSIILVFNVVEESNLLSEGEYI